MKTVQLFDGKAGSTFSQASTDTAQTLTSANISGKAGAIISVETNPIRYSFTATPTQAGLGHIATAGTTITLNSGNLLRNFKFISQGAGNHATLQITPLESL